MGLRARYRNPIPKLCAAAAQCCAPLTLRLSAFATSNIGCLQHLNGPDAPPIVHIAELLDWAEGGPLPNALHARGPAAGRAA